MRRRIGFLELYDTLGMALMGVIVIALQVNEYLHTHSIDAVEIIGVVCGTILVVLGMMRYLKMLGIGNGDHDNETQK